jgi:hypothetical protein
MWYAQVNDLVGGWIVTDLNKPLSEHDFRPFNHRNEENYGYVIAECMNQTDAERIADLLNIDEKPVCQACLGYITYHTCEFR